MKTYTYLALGDSYTIGEHVTLAESFPYQTVQLLRKAGLIFQAPEILAATGWTTEDLKQAMDENILLSSYDFVSLLIGVNNQYKGRSADEFRVHFRMLLELAIERANGFSGNVTVLSIPDWGITPFAVHNSSEKIRSEIDMYNFICQAEAEHFQVNFLDITTSQRQDGNLPGFLARDMLHPSASEYFKWAEQLCGKIITTIEAEL